MLNGWVNYCLKAGGYLISIPHQYPSTKLIDTAMKKLYGIDLVNYRGKVAYIQSDPHAVKCKRISDEIIEANMVIPECWDEAIQEADKMIEKNDLGTMAFGSALNLLLFSNTYKDRILKKLKEVKFVDAETNVPISKEMLQEISRLAEMSRKKRIPEIRKI